MTFLGVEIRSDQLFCCCDLKYTAVLWTRNNYNILSIGNLYFFAFIVNENSTDNGDCLSFLWMEININCATDLQMIIYHYFKTLLL